MARMLLLGICVCGLGACAEPFIVFPGGTLAGEVTDPPADWSELASTETIQLETRLEDPYSVNVWVAGIGADIYVATGEGGTNWSEYLQTDHNVRIRINGKIYELLAVRVNDAAEWTKVAHGYMRKYDVEIEEGWVVSGQVFRLDRR